MSFTNWINQIKLAEKKSLIQGKCRKIHYKFPDGTEMAEEYSMDTGVVQKRAWKKQGKLGGESDWVLELGDVVRPLNDTNFTVKESNTEPVLNKRVTRINLEWRIRNLPYPLPTYSVSVDNNKRKIIVRTSNKKYYKEIIVPELDRCNTELDQSNISISHQYNTLIITYKKPQILVEMEKAVLLELKDVETESDSEMITDEFLKQLMK